MHYRWSNPDEFTEAQKQIYNQVLLMTKTYFNWNTDFHKEEQLDIFAVFERKVSYNPMNVITRDNYEKK